MVKKSTFCCILTELFLLKYTSMCKSQCQAVCFVSLCSLWKVAHVPSDRGCTVLKVFVPQYLTLFQLPFPPLLPPMVLMVHGQKCH